MLLLLLLVPCLLLPDRPTVVLVLACGVIIREAELEAEREARLARLQAKRDREQALEQERKGKQQEEQQRKEQEEQDKKRREQEEEEKRRQAGEER